MKKTILSYCIAAISLQATAQTLVFHSFFNGNLNDISSNALHGTFFGGTPTYVTGASGVPGTALHLDGVNDYVRLPSSAATNLSSWTIQAMVRFNGFYNGICQASSIVWHGTQFQQNCYSLFMADNAYETVWGVPPGQTVCTFNSGWDAFSAFGPGSSTTPDFVCPYYTTNGFVTTGVWYCVTATLTSALAGSVMSIYIDGTLIEQGTWNGGLNYNYTGNDFTYIGCSNTPGGTFPYWLNGDLDQVSIFDGVLSASTIGAYCQKTLTNSWRQSSPNATEQEEMIKSVNIMQIADDNIVISPNPANDQIKVSVPQYWKGGKMVVINGVGQVMMEQSVQGTMHTIDISELPIGIYMLKTMKGKEVRVEKFIKN